MHSNFSQESNWASSYLFKKISILAGSYLCVGIKHFITCCYIISCLICCRVGLQNQTFKLITHHLIENEVWLAFLTTYTYVLGGHFSGRVDLGWVFPSPDRNQSLTIHYPLWRRNQRTSRYFKLFLLLFSICFFVCLESVLAPSQL